MAWKKRCKENMLSSDPYFGIPEIQGNHLNISEKEQAITNTENPTSDHRSVRALRKSGVAMFDAQSNGISRHARSIKVTPRQTESSILTF